MLFHDDVVTDGEAKPGAFPGRFSCEERREQLPLHLRRNTRAIVADTDLYPVAEIFGRRGQGRLVVAAIALGFPLRRRIEAVRDQVQQNAGDVLWEHVDFTGGRIEGSLQGDGEARLLGPRPVIGKIEALLDEAIDVDESVFTRAFARVQQHVLDNRIGPFAVLHDLGKIAPQCVCKLDNLGPRFLVYRYSAQGILQFIDQFGRNTREVIDEIERVLDLVGNAGGELTEGGELLRLNKAILRRPQVVQRFRQFPRAGFDVLEQPRVLDRHNRLVSEGLQQFNSGLWKLARRFTPDPQRTDNVAWTPERG